MRIFKQSVGTVAISALVLASCTATTGGATLSTLSGSAAVNQGQVFDASALDDGDGLVLIRYPAFLDDDARSMFFAQYGQRTIGDKAPPAGKYLDNAEQLATAFMLKNHYFAVSLYKALKTRLPADTVFLSPHMVYYDVKEGLTSKPVMSAETIPHAITVDFSTYTYPDSDSLLSVNAATFGDTVTPLAVVRTSHRALPQTNGLLAASAPLMSTAWTDAQRNVRPIDLGAPDDMTDSHILIDFLDGQRTQQVKSNLRVTEPVSRKINLARIDSLPVEKVQMDGDTIARLARRVEGLEADPFGQVYSQGFAERIVAYLNAIDIPKATAVAKQRAVASFDYDAAHLYYAASTNRSVGTRIDFAERLLKAERRYLAGQSEALEDSMGNDQFGRKLAELMAAEQENLREQRELERKRRSRQALAFLGALAAGGAIYMTAKSNRCDPQRETEEECERRQRNRQRNVQILATASVGMISYGLISSKTKKLQRQMSSANFLASIAPSLNTTQAVTVDLVEGTEQITAANYPELREKMLGLYRTRLRSLDYSAVPCTFSSPDVTTLGTWYGPCADGTANGDGYGSIDLGGAGKIEYFGTAAAGFAQGEGYLLTAGQEGRMLAYEGTFQGGRPHGAVRKIETGKSPQTGVYQDGKRIGRLPTGVTVPQVLAQQESAYGYGR